MKFVGALESVRVVGPSTAIAFSGRAGKDVNFTSALHLQYPKGPLLSSLSLTLPTGFLFRTKSSSKRIASFCCFAALTPELQSTLDKVVTSNKVVLFMKGTKDFPQCGFSHTVVQILNSLNVPFETINILENELLRQGLKEYSSWPTFPQLIYIDGEFFGDSDITVD